MVKTIKIKILDNEYVIKSEEDIDRAHKIAEYVNEKVKEINNNSEGLSEKRTVILAALDIASEYFELLKERDDLLANISKRSKILIHNIDTLMG